MLCPSLLRKEMGDLVLEMSAAFSSGLRLWLSEDQRQTGKKMNNQSEQKNTGRCIGPISPPGGTVSLNIS